MPTVIDSLVVTLGLDASKFNEEQKKAVASLQKFEDSATKHSKSAQKGVDDLVGSFRELQGRLLAIGALIAAGLGFNRLVQDVTKANTELGYLSKTLGIAAQDLSAWEQVGRTVGATAEDMKQNLASLNAEIQEFHATGSSKLGAFMGQVGIKPLQPNDTPDAVAKRLSQWYVNQPDKAFAGHLLQSRGGLSQGMINLLGLGPEELQKRLENAKRFAPKDEEIAKFQKLTEAFGNLMNVMDRLTTQAVLPFVSALTKILDMLTKWLGKWSESGEGAPDAAGRALGQMGGMHELEPKAGKPSLFQRGWNWLTGRSPSGETGATTPGPSSGGANDNTPTSGGSAFLSGQRSAFTEQLNDPGVRERVKGMAVLEGTPTQTIESLANRFGYVNEQRARQGLPPLTVDQMLTSGFYGPINRGGLPGAVSQLRSNSELSRRMDAAVNSVTGGSNTIGGYTDQGLPTDPNGWRQPQIRQGGNVFTDWNGGPGGAAASAAYRERLQAGVRAEQAATAQSTIRPRLEVTPSSGSQDTGASRTFELWQSLGLGAKGGAMRGGGSTSNTNNSNSTTNIHSMNVTVPPGADPSAYADGISRRLSDYNNVQNSNTGMV